MVQSLFRHAGMCWSLARPAAEKVITTVAAETEKRKIERAQADTLQRKKTTQMMWEADLQKELEYQREMGLR